MSIAPTDKIYLSTVYIITYPNADDGGRRIIPLLEAYAAGQPERVLAIPSLGQVRYLSAIKHAAAVIGNSSSGIIEVPAMDVPTVNIGMRQKGRLAAKSVLHCDADTASIQKAISAALKREYKLADEKIHNPYGQGDASRQVIQLLKSLSFNAVKTFHDVKVNE